MSIAELTTARLHLRGVTMADVPPIQRNFDDYEIIRHLVAMVPWPFPAHGARDFVERLLPVQGKSRWVWGLFLTSAPEEMIGNVDLRRAAWAARRG